MPKRANTAQIRPSMSMAARVQEDEDFRPLAVSLGGKVLEVVSIDEWVEEEAEWWEPEPVFKMHYHVTLEDGQQMAIFRNMMTGGWYRSESMVPEA